MSKQVRVNIRTAINAEGIKRERRNGRDYIIVPSATLPDNIVMNRIRYPAAEIAKSFSSLENTPAPLGHPTIEGAFVSAKDPEGLARGWVGAWNRNVRRHDGRVHLDKVIDVATASQLEGGKAVLKAIEKGEPVHTSTGLYGTLTALSNDADADWEIGDMVFDHDAILLGEDGAATPADGVGMMVNKAQGEDGKPVDVINSALSDDIDRDLSWAAESALRAIERSERLPLLERIKEVITETVRGLAQPGNVTNEEDSDMDDAKIDELSAKVDSLAETVGGIDDKIATAVGNALTEGLKPLTEKFAADEAEKTAKLEADKAALVNKIVEGGLLDEETAKAADISVLNALAEKLQPGKAALLNGKFKPQAESGFKLREGD